MNSSNDLHREKVRQYDAVNLAEAAKRGGFCYFIPQLLIWPEKVRALTGLTDYQYRTTFLVEVITMDDKNGRFPFLADFLTLLKAICLFSALQFPFGVNANSSAVLECNLKACCHF